MNARAVLARLRDIAARLRLAATGFSIVSQNCIGGCMYHDLGLPFSSPTVNLVIPGEGFVRLVEDLPHYLSIEAVPAGWCEEDEKRFPLLRVDDVIVHAMHYASGEEAAAAWNRRRKRVNLGDVRVIACDWDLGERPEPLVARASWRAATQRWSSRRARAATPRLSRSLGTAGTRTSAEFPTPSSPTAHATADATTSASSTMWGG